MKLYGIMTVVRYVKIKFLQNSRSHHRKYQKIMYDKFEKQKSEVKNAGYKNSRGRR